MSSIIRWRSGVTDWVVIDVSCLKRGEPHDLQTDRAELHRFGMTANAATAVIPRSGLVLWRISDADTAVGVSTELVGTTQ
jgi:hypothetical protein